MTFEVVHYKAETPGWENIVPALLSPHGFDAFSQEEDGWWQASRPEATEGREQIQSIIESIPFAVEWRLSHMGETNWNAVWEASYAPVKISDAIGIRAAFHEAMTEVEEEFVVEAAMAFGTGHHATTRMMAAWLPGKVAGKRVLDMGTGTGILACIALRFGAEKVWAIDNDPKAVASAETLRSKEPRAGRMELTCAAEPPEGEAKLDLILANIQLHVILEQLPAYTKLLCPGGFLLLSGILESKVAPLLDALKEHGLSLIEKQQQEEWLLLVCQK